MIESMICSRNTIDNEEVKKISAEDIAECYSYGIFLKSNFYQIAFYKTAIENSNRRSAWSGRSTIKHYKSDRIEINQFHTTLHNVLNCHNIINLSSDLQQQIMKVRLLFLSLGGTCDYAVGFLNGIKVAANNQLNGKEFSKEDQIMSWVKTLILSKYEKNLWKMIPTYLSHRLQRRSSGSVMVTAYNPLLKKIVIEKFDSLSVLETAGEIRNRLSSIMVKLGLSLIHISEPTRPY